LDALFIRFHRLRHPLEMGAPEIIAFLTYLANERQCSPSTLLKWRHKSQASPTYLSGAYRLLNISSAIESPPLGR
jgi:hypothetical protein